MVSTLVVEEGESWSMVRDLNLILTMLLIKEKVMVEEVMRLTVVKMAVCLELCFWKFTPRFDDDYQ